MFHPEKSQKHGRAFRDHIFRPQLAEAQVEATRLGVTGVPTFFIEDKKSIVGAQPLDVFRKALRSR